MNHCGVLWNVQLQSETYAGGKISFWEYKKFSTKCEGISFSQEIYRVKVCRDHHNGGGCPPESIRRRSNASWVILRKEVISMDVFFMICSIASLAMSAASLYLQIANQDKKTENDRQNSNWAIVFANNWRTTVIGDPFSVYIITWISAMFCEMCSCNQKLIPVGRYLFETARNFQQNVRVSVLCREYIGWTRLLGVSGSP